MDSGQLQACPCSTQDAGRTVHRLPSRSEALCVRRQEEWSWPRRVLAQRALTVTWRAQQAVGVAVAPDRRRRRVPLWRHQRGGFFQRIDDAAVAVIGETWYLSCRDRREWSRLTKLVSRILIGKWMGEEYETFCEQDLEVAPFPVEVDLALHAGPHVRELLERALRNGNAFRGNYSTLAGRKLALCIDPRAPFPILTAAAAGKLKPPQECVDDLQNACLLVEILLELGVTFCSEDRASWLNICERQQLKQ